MRILEGSMSRSKQINRNIFLSFFNKFIAVFVSFQIIPATIGYVDTSLYGVWITISSVAAWIIYFDFGLTHGFRNGFASAIAKNDIRLAKQYISTTYAILVGIFSILLIIGLISNYFIDWALVLNIDQSFSAVLSKVFIILIVFLCIQMVANVFTTFLLAFQKTAASAMVITSGQVCALIAIYIYSNFTEGSLINLAFALIGVPAVTILLLSIVAYKFKFESFTPSLSAINWGLRKDIIGLGMKFFVIQLSMLFVFQFANFILIYVMGSDAVTNYNIAYRYYSIIYIALSLVFAPYWSAFTDAYAKGEFDWMKLSYSKLSKLWYGALLIFILLLILAPLVYKYWLTKGMIDVDYGLAIAMGIHMIILSRANLYMSCLNGMGKVYLQTLIYLIFAVVSVPMMYYLTVLYGYYGIIIVSTAVYLSLSVISHIQLNKILNKKDYGIWSK